MNIVFDRIYLSGFLAIGEAEVSLHEQGFTLVSGINNEASVVQSNGSGKSTIFEGIMWTLTGETMRGSSEIINEYMKDQGCECQLDFHDDLHSYSIKRARGHANLGNQVFFYEDGELITDQIKLTQEKINSLFPILSTPETLGSIILLGQGLPYRFSSLSPIKRKELLETMTGSTTELEGLSLNLSKIESEHNATLRTYTTDNSKYEGLVQGQELSIKTLEEQKQLYSDSDKIKSEIQELQEREQTITSTLSNSRERQGQLTRDHTEILDKLSQLQEEENKYKSSLSLVKNQLDSIVSGNCPTCGRPYEITEESLKLKSTLENKVNQISKLLADVSESLTRTASDAHVIQVDINSITYEIQKLEQESRDIQYKVLELNKGLETSEQLQNKIDKINDEILKLKLQINENEKNIVNENEYLECINYLKRQLSREFKGYLLEEVIKYLSSRTNYYSQFLFTNGKTIDITLSGNKILISVGGRLYENLSGGERQRVDLAVQFSLRDLLIVTSGFSCNLLVLDEVFDNLDSQGSSALIKLIVTEFSNIDSVFIITHHSEIDIPYDNQITVVKGASGVSELR